MLTKGGWIGAILIALAIILAFGYHFLIYPIIFLALGSLVSKINKNKEDKYRDSVQVFSNAGVALLCSLFFIVAPNPILTNAFVLSFAVALSDTFSSELGKYFKGRTIDILRFHKVEDGLSGGISIQGTLAGIIGSLIIAFISYATHTMDLKEMLTITLYGIFGMLMDSVLGSSIQAKYLVQNKIMEKGKTVDLVSGYHWVDNNVVNFLSILFTVCIYLVLH